MRKADCSLTGLAGEHRRHSKWHIGLTLLARSRAA
jgi:hypothetical protein